MTSEYPRGPCVVSGEREISDDRIQVSCEDVEEKQQSSGCSTRRFLERRLFGVHSGVEFVPGRRLYVRSWVRTVDFQPAGCRHHRQAHAGT